MDKQLFRIRGTFWILCVGLAIPSVSWGCVRCEGIVCDETGAPLGGAEVEFQSVMQSVSSANNRAKWLVTVAGRTVTDSRGRFHGEIAPNGARVFLVVKHHDFDLHKEAWQSGKEAAIRLNLKRSVAAIRGIADKADTETGLDLLATCLSDTSVGGLGILPESQLVLDFFPYLDRLRPTLLRLAVGDVDDQFPASAKKKAALLLLYSVTGNEDRLWGELEKCDRSFFLDSRAPVVNDDAVSEDLAFTEPIDERWRALIGLPRTAAQVTHAESRGSSKTTLYIYEDVVTPIVTARWHVLCSGGRSKVSPIFWRRLPDEVRVTH